MNLNFPELHALTNVGLTVLGAMFFLQMSWEVIQLMRGEKPDFVGTTLRYAGCAALLYALPKVSLLLSSTALSSSKWISGMATQRTFQDSWEGARKALACQGSMSIVPFSNMFSLSGWLIAGGNGILLLVAFMKMVVIDVWWPLELGLVVVSAPIRVPLNFIPSMGGIWPYLKQLLAVAIWPVAFAMLMLVFSLVFSQMLTQLALIGTEQCYVERVAENLAAVASGQKTVPQTTAAAAEGVSKGFFAILKFLAMCCVLIVMTFRIPAFCSKMFGLESTGVIASAIGGALSGAATGAATAAQVAAVVGTGGAAAPAAGAATAATVAVPKPDGEKKT